MSSDPGGSGGGAAGAGGSDGGSESVAGGVDPLAVARLLRQREEIGLPPLVLSRETREAVLAAVTEAGARAGKVAAAERRTAAATGGGKVAATDRSTGAPATGAAATGPAPHGAAPKRGGAPQPPKTGAGTRPGGGLPVLDLSATGYDELREQALGCTRCGLAETRTQVVFSDGNPGGRLVVVGEAPGANEDRTGLPFVGQAGKLLDLMLATVELSREDSVYICNVIKCRPPGNRNPTAAEIRACSPWLLRQLELVEPRALLAVGTFAGQLLTSSDQPLGKLRGRQHSYQGIPLVVTYHPAALLRNPGWYRAAWDDLQLLRQVMD